MIADELKISQAKISNIIKKRQMSQNDKDFTPYLYNIWNLQKQEPVLNHHRDCRTANSKVDYPAQ
jgi:hypothetical protein